MSIRVDDVTAANREAECTVSGSVPQGDASEWCVGHRPFDFELHAVGETGYAADEHGIRPLYGNARGWSRSTLASIGIRHRHHRTPQGEDADDEDVSGGSSHRESG
jgi:hypothetical protein